MAELAAAGALLGALALAVQQLAPLSVGVVPAALLAYAGVAAPLAWWHRRAPLTPADRVTLARAVLVTLLAGLLPWAGELAGQAWWVVLLAALALALDGVDGAVARRTGTATAAGARFDMELDAAFLLVLSAWLVGLGLAGPWVLAIGLLRYAFVAAGGVVPALRRELPPSWRRKAVCAVQGAVLAACLAPPLAPVAPWLAGAALGLLGYSFGADVLWLLRNDRDSAGEGNHV